MTLPSLPPNYDAQMHMVAHEVHGRTFHATILSVMLTAELINSDAPADIAEAAAIFRAVLNCQELRDNDPHRGNFRWELEDEVVEDLNAVQFVLFYFIPVLCKTPELLPPDELCFQLRHAQAMDFAPYGCRPSGREAVSYPQRRSSARQDPAPPPIPEGDDVDLLDWLHSGGLEALRRHTYQPKPELPVSGTPPWWRRVVDVLATDPVRAALLAEEDQNPGLARDCWLLAGDPDVERPRFAGDAEVSAVDAALLDQQAGDPAGGVDGDGEANALGAADDGGVDADDTAVRIDERSAGVAGVERGVGLDHVFDRATALAAQRPTEGGDDAGGDGRLEAERVADGPRAPT